MKILILIALVACFGLLAHFADAPRQNPAQDSLLEIRTQSLDARLLFMEISNARIESQRADSAFNARAQMLEDFKQRKPAIAPFPLDRADEEKFNAERHKPN